MGIKYNIQKEMHLKEERLNDTNDCNPCRDGRTAVKHLLHRAARAPVYIGAARRDQQPNSLSLTGALNSRSAQQQQR